MSQNNDQPNLEVVSWLAKFSQSMESDPDILDAMPIEDVRRELSDLGADVEGFHASIAKMLNESDAKVEPTVMLDLIALDLYRPSKTHFDPQPLLEAAADFKLPIAEVVSADERVIVEAAAEQLPEDSEFIVDLDVSFYGSKTEKVAMIYHMVDRSEEPERLFEEGEIRMVWTESGGIGRWRNKNKHRSKLSTTIGRPVLIIKPQSLSTDPAKG